MDSVIQPSNTQGLVVPLFSVNFSHNKGEAEVGYRLVLTLQPTGFQSFFAQFCCNLNLKPFQFQSWFDNYLFLVTFFFLVV